MAARSFWVTSRLQTLWVECLIQQPWKPRVRSDLTLSTHFNRNPGRWEIIESQRLEEPSKIPNPLPPCPLTTSTVRDHIQERWPSHSVGSLCQCQTTLTEYELFLISNMYFPCQNLRQCLSPALGRSVTHHIDTSCVVWGQLLGQVEQGIFWAQSSIFVQLRLGAFGLWGNRLINFSIHTWEMQLNILLCHQFSVNNWGITTWQGLYTASWWIIESQNGHIWTSPLLPPWHFCRSRRAKPPNHSIYPHHHHICKSSANNTAEETAATPDERHLHQCSV